MWGSLFCLKNIDAGTHNFGILLLAYQHQVLALPTGQSATVWECARPSSQLDGDTAYLSADQLPYYFLSPQPSQDMAPPTIGPRTQSHLLVGWHQPRDPAAGIWDPALATIRLKPALGIPELTARDPRTQITLCRLTLGLGPSFTQQWVGTSSGAIETHNQPFFYKSDMSKQRKVI